MTCSQKDNPPSICVFGGGAVGQYLAGMLSMVPEKNIQTPRLSLVCRGSTLSEIKQAGGITVRDVPRDQEFAAKNFQLMDSANLGDDLQHPDVILSCAKAHHLPAALPALKRLMGPNTLLVTIQNGLPFHHGHLTSHPALAGKHLPAVDPDGTLFNSFSSHQVVPGVVYVAAERTGVAEVTCRSAPTVTKFMFGKVLEATGGCRTGALQGVVHCLTRVQVMACIEPDILSCIWHKLLASACVNPTNALAHGYIDTLLKSPRTAPLIEALASEVMSVGEAVGATYERTAAEWRTECAAKWPKCKVSMLQDVEAGRELEIAALVLVVSDIARDLGILTPRLDTIAALIHHRNENLIASTQETCEAA